MSFLVWFGCAADEIDLVGIAERRVIELAAPRSEILVELPVAAGGAVAAGTVVARLDPQLAGVELTAQEASLAAARARLVETQGEFTRQEQLRRSRVATAQAFDAAKRGYEEAVALVAEREAQVARARKQLADLELTSHLAAIVDQLPFDVGERVPAGGVVAILLSNESPWVRVWMPARFAARLRPGAPAQVSIEGYAQPFSATVSYIAHEPEFTPHYALTERESARLVFETRLLLENAPADLRPGLPARVRIDRVQLDKPAASGAGA